MGTMEAQPTRRAALQTFAGSVLAAALGPTRSSQGVSCVVTVDVAPGLKIHGLQTGTVRVKRAHREWKGPSALRLPAIVASRRWTEDLPILCWLIEEGERRILVDTGETHRTAEPDWFDCDPGTGWFYNRNLRLDVPGESDEAGPLLRQLDLEPSGVDTVVMTHLHSDHAGGMSWFPEAKFFVGGDYPSARGTLPCRYPEWLDPERIESVAGAWGPFDAHHRLSESVRIVPTPGHSLGHHSVVVETEVLQIVLAGDASFTAQQMQKGHTAGICEAPRRARRTLERLRQLCADKPTVYLPSHDPESLARLRALTVEPGAGAT